MEDVITPLDKRVQNAVGKVVLTLLKTEARKASKYISEKMVVRAARKCFKGKLPAKNQNPEIILTIGRPNFRQRMFIKSCIKAGESFPVKKIQLQFPVQK